MLGWGCVQPPLALFTVEATVENMEPSELPTDWKAVMPATETRAAIRPYSMAVAPDSSFRKAVMVFMAAFSGVCCCLVSSFERLYSKDVEKGK